MLNLTGHHKAIAVSSLSVIFWASAFPGMKTALHSYQPGDIMASRFMIASFIMLLYAGTHGMRFPALKDIPAFVFIGFMGFTVANFGYTYSQQYIPAGMTSMISAITPMFSTVLAVTFLHERLSKWGWLGVLISLGGIIVLSLSASGEVGLNQGVLISVVSACSIGIMFVLQKRYLDRYTPIEITTYSMVGGTLFMLGFVPSVIQTVPDAQLSANLAVIFLAIFPTSIAYLAWAYASNTAPLSITANILYFIPVVGLVIAWLWLGEVPTVGSLFGGGLILMGMLIVQKLGTQRVLQTDHTEINY